MAEQEVETTFNDSGLKIYFVLKNGLKGIDDVSNDMNVAYTNIQEYFPTGEALKWVTEPDCLEMNDLTKKDVFVLQEFFGDAFNHLKVTRSLVVGPRCLISCLLETTSIPPNKSPVFTTAMRNLYICASGLTFQEKSKVKNLVLWMGGFYSDDLLASCTHLVSNTVRSSKYEQAAISGKIIMHPDWIYDVWERSQNENILATSKEFNKHKLPIFFNLNITSTGLSNDLKNDIRDLVIKHGGNYQGRFQSKITEILILEKNSTDSQKYRAAIEFKKDCLLPTWITDSVDKGYALPLKEYRVKAIKVSTPTKNQGFVSATDFNPDSTELSEISQLTNQSNLISSCDIDETCSSRHDVVLSGFKRPSQQRKSYQDVMNQLESFSSRDIKKAGTFLDGCRIYLTGFTFDEKEKLNKILNSGGAIRYEEINDNVTHIIVGELTKSQEELHSKLQNNTQLMGIVKLSWLLESFKSHQPVDENNFLYREKLKISQEPEAPSPSSKKTIQSMNHSFKKPALPKRKLDLGLCGNEKDSSSQSKQKNSKDNDIDDENDLLQQYNPKNISSLIPVPSKNQKSNDIKTSIEPQPGPSRLAMEPLTNPTLFTGQTATTSTSTYTDGGCGTEDFDSQEYDFFDGLAIYVHEPDDEELLKQLTIHCENAGGMVVSPVYKQIVDYVIVSSERTTDLKDIPVKGKNVVNTLWLEDAMFKNSIVEKKYYHELIPTTADKKPLEGINIVISIYTENERVYLQSLITILGATASETYMKKERPLLICPSSEGAKYEAAVRWKYPVVTSDWLVECAKLGKVVELKPYLVGEATLSESWVQSQFPKQFQQNNETTSAKLTEDQQSKTNRMDVDMEEDDFQGFIIPENRNVNDMKEKEEKNDVQDVHTPDNLMLRHRRISELGGARNITRRSISTPITTATTTTSAEPENNQNLTTPTSEFVKRFSTPNRECIYNVMKEMENKETPPSQRIRKFLETPGKQKKSTPKVPEFCTTPEIQRRRLEFCDRYYLPKTERRPNTPLSEIKKNFWKQALGEHYWEPEVRSQIELNDDDVFGPPSTSASKSPQKQINPLEIGSTQNAFPTTVPTNEHIRRLSDFIKNRDSDIENQQKQQQIQDTEDDNVFMRGPDGGGGGGVGGSNDRAGLLHKFDSEMGGTEELVGWKDPSEFLPARRNQSRRRMNYQGTPKFSISCVNEQTKKQIIEKIKSLNGQICENLTNYDETCTHIVCEKMNRGEKILSCIAAGKWILSLKYIEDSYDEGAFLDEEEYEWGNPKSISNLSTMENVEQSIANAAYRWRTKLQSSQSDGVFNGFNCILHVSKKESFQRLIMAGGGTVLNVKSPYNRNQDALKATHCFVETRTTPLTRTDHLALQKAGVSVLSIMYLNAYLTNATQPDLQKFTLSL